MSSISSWVQQERQDTQSANKAETYEKLMLNQAEKEPP